MARVLVVFEPFNDLSDAVLMDETVNPVHIKDEHGKRQLLDRIQWAIADAEAKQTGNPHESRRYTEVGA